MRLLILSFLTVLLSSWSFRLRRVRCINEVSVLRRAHSSSVGSEKSLPIGQVRNGVPAKPLTQKEYLIAIRNRLYSVEEQLWLHAYAKSRVNAKVEVLSDAKYNELCRAKTELLKEYPLTKLYADLHDAQQHNMTYAAMYIDRLIANFNRQLPLPMNHANQIAVLSSSGQVMNLMRGQGAVSHRLLPSKVSLDSTEGAKRQFQHPAFSPSGKYVAFAEMHFRAGDIGSGSAAAPTSTTAISVMSGTAGGGSTGYGKDTKDTTAATKPGGLMSAEVLVFEVPTDPTKYGATDSTPLYQSGSLPGAPFFVRFSPDESKLVLLCAPSGGDAGDVSTTLLEIPWRQQRGESGASAGASAGNVKTPALRSNRQVTTLLKGSPLFFTYTTSAVKNATMVAHCKQDPSVDPTAVSDNTSIDGEAVQSEKAVYMLQPHHDSDHFFDTPSTPRWEKVSEGDPYTRWSTPICHSAGGGDSVLVVEDGWLCSRALSRWKRNTDGTPQCKRLRPVKGQVQFLVSPDSSRAVVLEEDVNAGHYALTVIEGEDALDPGSAGMGRQYELPSDQLTVAFWFSPDSTKLLCLNAAGKSKLEVNTLKSSFRVGLNSDMQWSVFNFPLNELREYDTFKPTPYFMKTYVPFFTQYAQVYNPWAPDSRSFLHMTSTGLCHTPLVDNKPCLGADRWQNQGATFGTWSRQ